ncbi:MAG: hypothetical protein KKD17_03435 [Nanoarchaeota archaeon]|nr:hypothetical protein [Nanoarchaeota archaeon]
MRLTPVKLALLAAILALLALGIWNFIHTREFLLLLVVCFILLMWAVKGLFYRGMIGIINNVFDLGRPGTQITLGILGGAAAGLLLGLSLENMTLGLEGRRVIGVFTPPYDAEGLVPHIRPAMARKGVYR